MVTWRYYIQKLYNKHQYEYSKWTESEEDEIYLKFKLPIFDKHIYEKEDSENSKGNIIDRDYNNGDAKKNLMIMKIPAIGMLQ